MDPKEKPFTLLCPSLLNFQQEGGVHHHARLLGFENTSKGKEAEGVLEVSLPTQCPLWVPVVTGYLPTLWVNILEGTYGERQDVERKPSLPAFTKALSLPNLLLLLAQTKDPCRLWEVPMSVPGLLSCIANLWLETQHKFPSHNPRGLEAGMVPAGLKVGVS